MGQALAPPVAGKIADLTGSFTPAFILSAVIAFIGMIGALLMRKTVENSPS
jgi:cyanate permease